VTALKSQAEANQSLMQWAKQMGTGWEKAPVEMLSQVSKKKNTAPCGRGGLCPDGILNPKSQTPNTPRTKTLEP
jgi:hypothetical protein